MRLDRSLFAFLLLLGLAGCSGKNAESNTTGVAASNVSGDAKPEQTPQEQGMSFVGVAGGDSADGKTAAEPADVIKGWGKKEDPAGGTTIELQDTTLVMTTPAAYVDNYPPGKVNAPRVMQEGARRTLRMRQSGLEVIGRKSTEIGFEKVEFGRSKDGDSHGWENEIDARSSAAIGGGCSRGSGVGLWLGGVSRMGDDLRRD